MLTKVLTTMEVPKVKKLCNELNQMGVKHLIFTLDNVSLKTFGDSDNSIQSLLIEAATIMTS